MSHPLATMGGLVALSLAGLAASGSGLSDEVADVVQLLAPLVGALLVPLGAAIGILFRTLQAEMRASRDVTRDVADVVKENTVAAGSLRGAVEQNTSALRSMATAIGRLEGRVTELERDHDRRKAD